MRKKSITQETRDLLSARTKQRGRPSPAAAPLAGKHLLLGGWPRNEKEQNGKMRNEVGHEEYHKRTQATFTYLQNNSLRRKSRSPSPEREKLEKHTHPRIGLVLHGSVEKRERWNKMKKLCGGGVAEWWVGEERKWKKNNGEWRGWRRAREKEKRVKQILF